MPERGGGLGDITQQLYVLTVPGALRARHHLSVLVTAPSQSSTRTQSEYLTPSFPDPGLPTSQLTTGTNLITV